MKSMTGYGASRWKSKDCAIEVVVQAYNSKNFEARMQAPPFYAGLEGELRRELQKKIPRGVVNVIITRSPLWPPKSVTISWNKKQALKWRALYNQMARSLKMKNDLSLFHLSEQAGVLELGSNLSVVPAGEKLRLKTLLRSALNLCEKEKLREGLALKKDFQKNLRMLSVSIKKIRAHANRQNKMVVSGMKQKLKSLLEEQKTAGEVTNALMNRMDISEELERMEEHIKVFTNLVSSQGTMGKKMSFYLQEMVREVNTAGSKSQDFKLTKEVVQAKTLIEKMREQVQNVE